MASAASCSRCGGCGRGDGDWGRGLGGDLAFTDGGEGGDELGVGFDEGRAAGELAHLGLDGVDGLEEQVHHGAIDDDDGVAGAVEGALGGVCDADEVGEGEEGGAALDGVEGAEDFVEELGVAGRVLEGDEIAFDLLEEFAGLGEEVLQDFGIEAVGHKAPLEEEGDAGAWKAPPRFT